MSPKKRPERTPPGSPRGSGRAKEPSAQASADESSNPDTDEESVCSSPPSGLEQTDPITSELGERPRVLVVDDDLRNRSRVRACLGPGMEVVEAADGPSALEVIHRDRIDLVILDVLMPGMNGFEVCRAIKQSAHEFLPVLIITALTDQEARNDGLESGADELVSKPIDRRELVLRVKGLLRARFQGRLIREQIRQLQDLDALKNDLVSMIVHDLRNPLAGVLGNLQLIAKDDLPAESRDAAAFALKAATRLEETLDDMLEVRLLEEGRLELSRTLVNASEVVNEAMVSVAGNARDRGVELKTELAELALFCDRKLTRRAIENLLSNAIKYSRRGGAVEIVAYADADGRPAIDVLDRGSGIPADTKSNLFEKFGTVRRSERRGFGLGLYFVKLVATAHQGEVEAFDRPGGGTRLRLKFPAA